jgi:NlpC/P60 family putative phage cell wall peptidase
MAIDPQAVVAAARGWIGTPYQHQASLKGVGCDCLGLLRGVWRELCGPEPEPIAPYTPDWSEATGAESLQRVLARHLTPVAAAQLAPGDVALLRMASPFGRASARPGAPAKHCGIIGCATASLLEREVAAGQGSALTLIHARQNRRVCEEAFTAFWRARLAYVFRL